MVIEIVMLRQVFLLTIFMIGIMFFMVGMHGIDNAWNLAYVKSVSGGSWFDSSFFLIMSPAELYSRSLMTVFFGFFLSVVSAMAVSRSFDRKKDAKHITNYLLPA